MKSQIQGGRKEVRQKFEGALQETLLLSQQISPAIVTVVSLPSLLNLLKELSMFSAQPFLTSHS